MKLQAINLLEFQKRFPNEEACLDHLSQHRWPEGFICPRCGHRKHSFIRSRRLYQCGACRYQASLTAGTIFHNTRTPIRKWFWMIFMMTRQKSGVAILRMQELLDIGSYRTAWLMGHKIRKAMADRDSLHKLGGLLEMDDTFSGSQKGARPHGKAEGGSKLVVSLEREGDRPGCCSMRIVDRIDPDHEGDTAPQAEKTSPNTNTVKEVVDLRLGDPNHDQESIASANVKPQFKGLRWVYAAIANVKGNIRGVHHGVSRKYLQRYLSEFCYRFNRRLRDRELFDRALTACLRARAATMAELTI